MSTRLVVFLALSSLAGFSQDTATPAAGLVHGSMHQNAYRLYTSPVTGAPYCGEVVTSRVQTLADGTHLTSESQTTKVCRDSMARTRNDRTGNLPIIEITDPVAHVWYVLDTQGKTAHKMAYLPPENSAPAARAQLAKGTFSTPAQRPASTTDPKAPLTATEKLEPQTIEGIKAEGSRTTTTWPEGSSLGNDRPVVSVNESWTSPELKIPLLTKNLDPRYGDRTEKLTNLIRREPDPSLFQPPPDYTIVEEKEDFTIKWGPQPNTSRTVLKNKSTSDGRV